MADVKIPDLVGSTQTDAEAKLRDAGLVVGPGTKASSAKPPGSVLSTNPAAGTVVSAGSAVNLEVSSGPAQVAVPDVGGLTQPAAEGALKNAGLTVGAVKKQHSNSVPAGGISDTAPDAGTLVNAGSPVALEISDGPEPDWSQYIPAGLFGLLGLIILGTILYAVTQSGQEFLGKLARADVARGLITYLIAITTVGIAIILAVSTLVLTEGDAGDKRFDRGKQVLTTLIGVLGTIVGFYFGSANESAQKPSTEQPSLADGVANKPYPQTILPAAGLTPPLKWTVAPALPSGLKLDGASGTISGTPTGATPKALFKFTVTDSAAPAASSTVDFNLEIK
jgi:hypothetical protein